MTVSIAAAVRPATADTASVGCDADSKHGVTTVGDAGNDGAVYVNSSAGTSNQHYYDLTAEAAVYDDPDCCKEMQTVAKLYRERKDCYDGSPCWAESGETSVTQTCEGENADTNSGYAAVSGDGG